MNDPHPKLDLTSVSGGKKWGCLGAVLVMIPLLSEEIIFIAKDPVRFIKGITTLIINIVKILFPINFIIILISIIILLGIVITIFKSTKRRAINVLSENIKLPQEELEFCPECAEKRINDSQYCHGCSYDFNNLNDQKNVSNFFSYEITIKKAYTITYILFTPFLIMRFLSFLSLWSDGAGNTTLSNLFTLISSFISLIQIYFIILGWSNKNEMLNYFKIFLYIILSIPLLFSLSALPSLFIGMIIGGPAHFIAGIIVLFPLVLLIFRNNKYHKKFSQN